MMRRNRVDHFAVASACRKQPGVWRPVGEYNSGMSADGTVGSICKASTAREASRSAYSPAGSFEARRVLTEFGARVEAGYIGVPVGVADAEVTA
ncbi:hypothetical protein ACIOKD_14450 [Streptomyces sp. NPDC087844]|uniref:hypothetical protein n=1 Tax=Streptomyces sp. NPDC087844 TaxID=3365805 RepID=UPI00382B49FC